MISGSTAGVFVITLCNFWWFMLLLQNNYYYFVPQKFSKVLCKINYVDRIRPNLLPNFFLGHMHVRIFRTLNQKHWTILRLPLISLKICNKTIVNVSKEMFIHTQPSVWNGRYSFCVFRGVLIIIIIHHIYVPFYWELHTYL